MSERPTPYSGFTGQFIAGEWAAGSSSKGVLHDLNPFDGSMVAEISLASVGDVEKAYQVAAAAQKAWAATGPSAKIDIFRKALSIVEARQGEIMDWVVKETGGTLLKAGFEWACIRGGLIEAMTLPPRVAGQIMPIDAPGKQSYVFREAVGVIGVISPWNFPLHLSHRSVAPARATGNAVVIKPAEDTPITGGLLLAKIYEEAGLPAGLLNVVIGDVAEIGDAFVTHPIPRLISFTGSTRVGRRIGQLIFGAKSIKHVGLELGGNAPLVVLDDADLDQAVNAAVFARFVHAGQICMSANRIIVDDALHDEFVERFVEKARGLRVGDPADPATAIGPLVNARQRDAALRNIAVAREAGYAEKLGGDHVGLLVPPHVFSGVANDSPFAQTELFAPIAPIIRARDEQEALSMANQTEFGLSSAVFTGDLTRGMRFARQVEAGMTHINDIPIQDSPFNMFGGEKNSGIGRFNGDWIVSELTRDHWITVQETPLTFPF
jgi:aldehyde dehydrogenase (NAD+)